MYFYFFQVVRSMTYDHLPFSALSFDPEFLSIRLPWATGEDRASPGNSQGWGDSKRWGRGACGKDYGGAFIETLEMIPAPFAVHSSYIYIYNIYIYDDNIYIYIHGKYLPQTTTATNHLWSSTNWNSEWQGDQSKWDELMELREASAT